MFKVIVAAVTHPMDKPIPKAREKKGFKEKSLSKNELKTIYSCSVYMLTVEV